MAQLVIAAAGAAIGGALAPAGFALFGLTGAQLGWMGGAMLGSALVGGTRQSGPRLDELRVTGTEYGGGIPWLAGSPRVPGDLIWASDRRETATTQEVGKGGGSEYTSYTYEIDALYLLSANELKGVTRVFNNGKLIWTLRSNATSLSLASSDQTDQWRRITFYSGAQNQLPDPTYDAAVGNAPAYTGRGTIFIEGLQLGQSGALPNITFESCAAVSVGGTSLNTQLAQIASVSASYPNDEASGLAAFANPDLGSVQFYIGSANGTARTVTVSEEGLVTLGGYFSYYRADIRSLGETDELASIGYSSSTSTNYTFKLYRGTGGSATDYVVPALINTFSISPVWALRAGVLYMASMAGGGGNAKTIYRFPSAGSPVGTYTPSNPVQSLAAGTDFLYGLEDWGSVGLTATDLIYKIDATTMALVGTVQSPYYPNRQSTGRLLVNEANELFYVRGTGIGTNAWWKYVGGSWVIVSNDLGVSNPGNISGGFASQTAIIKNTLYVVRFDATTHKFLVFRSNATLDPGAPLLQPVVEDLCKRSSMPAGTYDASALGAITRPVRALAVTGGSARQALEILQASHAFDCYVTDKLYFVPRGGAPAATIAAGDLATNEGEAGNEPFALTINSDIEMPGRIAVTYRNVAADHVTGVEQSDRGPSTQDSVQQVQLAIGMNPDEAKGVADNMVRDAYVSRITSQITLPISYTKLTPTDVVQVPDNDGTLYRMRITRRSDSGGVIKLDVVGDDGAIVVQNMATSADYALQTAVLPLAETVLRLLDIPILRDDDDDIGVYIALRGTAGKWPGGVVYDSSDDKTFSNVVADVSDAGVLGNATSVLATWARGAVMDRASTVLVDVGPGELSSVTLDQLYADASVNALLVGKEVVRFQTATLQSTEPNVYLVSGLLRGQRGTEWAVGTHASGEGVVLLRSRGLRRVQLDKSMLGSARYFKGVTRGGQPSKVQSTSITPLNVGQKAFAPVDLRATRDATGGLQFTWKPRTRLSASLTGPAGIVWTPEPTSSYRLDLYDGATLRGSVTSTTPNCSYSAAQQLADYGYILTSVDVKLYQITPAGDGYPLVTTVATGFVAETQSYTITLDGTFVSGVPILLRATGLAVENITYTTQPSDTDIDGVAVSLAAAIDAHPQYTSTSYANTVTITSLPGRRFTLSVAVGGSLASVGTNVVQLATQASAGSAYYATVSVANSQTGTTEPIPSGTRFGFYVERPIGNAIASVFYTTTAVSVRADVLNALAQAFRANAVLSSAGYGMSVGSSSTLGPYATVTGPLGTDNIYMRASLEWPFTLSLSVQDNGHAPVPETLPQIIDCTIVGTLTSGDVVEMTIDGETFACGIETGGIETRAEAVTYLAAAISNKRGFVAEASNRGLGGDPDSVRITRYPAGDTFTYSGLVRRSITATVSAGGGLPPDFFYGNVIGASAAGWLVWTAESASSGTPGVTNDLIKHRLWLSTSKTGPFTLARESTSATNEPENSPGIPAAFGRMISFGGYVLQLQIVNGVLSAGRSTKFVKTPLDASTAPTVVTPSISFLYPRTMVADGSRVLLFGEGNQVYSSTDFVNWTALGSMAGATFPYAIGSEPTILNAAYKFGSRFFMVFGSGVSEMGTTGALFYSDHADARTGWTAVTGLPVDGFNATMFSEMVSDGTYLYAATVVPGNGQTKIYRSADNGASWTLEFTAPTKSPYAHRTAGTTAVTICKFHVTGTTGSDKVRFYTVNGVTFEKTVGTTAWTSKASGLVNPFHGVEYNGSMVFTDSAAYYDWTSSAAVRGETHGVFTKATGF